MPLYEYECSDCGHRFILLRSFSQRSESAQCPECKSEATEPVISTVAATSSGCGGSNTGFT